MKKSIKVLAGAITATILTTAFNFIENDNYVSADDKISSINYKISDIEKKQKDLRSRLSALKGDISAKEIYRRELLDGLSLLEEQINAENEKINILERKIYERQENIQKIQQKVNENIIALGERLKAVYKAGDFPELAILLGVKNFDELLDKADMIQKLSKYDANLIEELQADILKILQEKNSLENDKKECEQSRLTLLDKVKELDALKKENEDILRDLKKRQSNIYAEINSNEAKKKSLQNKILKSNRPKILPLTSKKRRYIDPVEGHKKVSSGWGDGRRHNGIDIPAPKGTRVFAVADGLVVATNSTSSWGSGWGYFVKISHGDGYETMYAHLSEVLVRTGQSVKTGEVIGKVGSTGRSTGNHLHFGTSKNGKWYNPRIELG